MSTARYNFSKSHRVRSRIDFSAVFEAGIKQSRGPFTAFAVPTALKHPRIGLSVGRRVGNAPRRNRIKRLLRETFRLMQHDLPRAYDVVFIVRPHEPLTLAEYQQLLSAMMLKFHQSWESKSAAKEKPAS